MHGQKLVTIIIATYNRGNVLRHAIQSVINNTYANWELLVIGDACTDDSAEIVKEFNDPRISFTNLEQNFGEQSGPNNYGLERAQGDYIAFLNHDDFWFPDHLQQAVEKIQQCGADLVFSHAFRMISKDKIEILGGSEDGKYHPYMGVPASLWLFRRQLYEEMGGWRSWDQTYNAPSQDWIYRVWKRGKNILSVDNISVIIVPSGLRKNSYTGEHDDEHDNIAGRLLNPVQIKQDLLENYALQKAAEQNSQHVLHSFRMFLKRVFFRIAKLIGVSPYAMLFFLKYRKKRGYIRHLRKIRGLADRPNKER